MPHRILIVGCIGFGNAGDEAIAEVTVGHLRENIPGAEITIVSGDPAHTASSYGVRAIGWRDPLAIAEAVQNTDLTILGGGGLFQDYWGFDPNAVLTREQWGLSFYTAPALLSAVCGRPVMLYAVGVGPLLSHLGRQYTRAAAEIAQCITVRDFASQELLESIGVPAEKILVTADPAFDLEPEAADGQQISEWTGGRPAIAVCLRNWSFATDQLFCERQLAAALDEVLETEGGRALFLPFHRAGGLSDEAAQQAHDDRIAAGRIRGHMKNREKAAILEEPCSPAKLAGIIGKADLMMGMRLHSIIFSIVAGTPFVALEYDPKVAALSSLTGFEEYTLPYGVESDVLAERMRRALREGGSLRERALDLARKLRARARENAPMAAELLQNCPGAADYGPETRALVSRMVTTLVAANDRLAGRVRACYEVLGMPGGEITAPDMAGWIEQGLRDGRAESERLRGELEEARGKTESERELHANTSRERDQARWEAEQAKREAAAAEMRRREETRQITQELTAQAVEKAGLARELEETRQKLEEAWRALEGANAQKQAAEWQSAAAMKSFRMREERLAELESKRPGAIAKRGLQLVLDVFQMITPGPLRRSIRKYYLNWFYFRIYPERRPDANG